jgi:hypothetical protein
VPFVDAFLLRNPPPLSAIGMPNCGLTRDPGAVCHWLSNIRLRVLLPGETSSQHQHNTNRSSPSDDGTSQATSSATGYEDQV